MKQRLRNAFTCYISLQIYTRHKRVSKEQSIWNKNKEQKSSQQNPNCFLVRGAVCLSSTSIPYHRGSCSCTNLYSLASAPEAPGRQPGQVPWHFLARDPTGPETCQPRVTSAAQMEQEQSWPWALTTRIGWLLAVWFLKPNNAVTLVNFNYLPSFPRKWIQVLFWLLR